MAKKNQKKTIFIVVAILIGLSIVLRTIYKFGFTGEVFSTMMIGLGIGLAILIVLIPYLKKKQKK
ncbi:hypothetical protein ACFLZB_00520 [Nanoarchaeota archaeon]